MKTLKEVGVVALILAGTASILWMIYHPDTYAPPRRVQRIEMVP